MIKYKVIEHINRESFEVNIECLMADGWKLQGGVNIVRSKTAKGKRCLIYAQAVIKEEGTESD